MKTGNLTLINRPYDELTSLTGNKFEKEKIKSQNQTKLEINKAAKPDDPVLTHVSYKVRLAHGFESYFVYFFLNLLNDILCGSNISSEC